MPRLRAPAGLGKHALAVGLLKQTREAEGERPTPPPPTPFPALAIVDLDTAIPFALPPLALPYLDGRVPLA